MLPSQEPAGRFSFLRSPLVFGGAALVVGVAMGVVVALVVAGDGDDGAGTPVVRRTSAPSPVSTNEAEETPAGGEVVGRATATISVHSGPGTDYQALGTIPKDKEVEVIGRDEEGEWLEVYFLPPSRLTGWVSAAMMEVEGEMAGVPVATPQVIAQPEVPTSVPPPPEPTTLPEDLTPTAEASPTATPAPEMPDLVVGGAPLVQTTLLAVTVTNQGAGELTERAIEIWVLGGNCSDELRRVNSPPHTLAPGASIDVLTGYDIRGGPPRLCVIIDPRGVIDEADNTNNRLIFTVTAATPTQDLTGTPANETPTPTPTLPTSGLSPSPTSSSPLTPTPSPTP